MTILALEYGETVWEGLFGNRMRNGDCLLGSELRVCISRPTGAASNFHNLNLCR